MKTYFSIKALMKFVCQTNITVHTVSLFFWLFHYEWKIQILDIKDQIKRKDSDLECSCKRERNDCSSKMQ